MDLRAWLRKPGNTKYGLAKRAGVTWRTVHRIALGHVPRASTARLIEKATDGEVTAAEILGVVPRSKGAALCSEASA